VNVVKEVGRCRGVPAVGLVAVLHQVPDCRGIAPQLLLPPDCQHQTAPIYLIPHPYVDEGSESRGRCKHPCITYPQSSSSRNGTSSLADGSSYWRWREELLKHPDGRATGGEPCAVCSEPVPANAPWQHRDRHACSSRCNRLLCRRFNRSRERSDDLPPEPDPLSNPRRLPVPHHFRTLPNVEFPYEFDGFGPLPGDIVERFGVTTSYSWLPSRELEYVPEYAPEGFHVALHESGHSIVLAAGLNGEAGRVIHGEFSPNGERRDPYSPFRYQCRELAFCHEIIRDVAKDGRIYDWEAFVCIATTGEHPQTIWSPSYAVRSSRLGRVSASTARHSRRVRLENATTERFDPLEVFERDGWLCKLCGVPVDRDVQWPDPLSSSLDHILPLVAGGEHSRANTQLAHWICNVRKGARIETGIQQ
jgi:hypothetical protein